MNVDAAATPTPPTAIIGTHDFCRRFNAIINNEKHRPATCAGRLDEAWSLMVTHRPKIVFIEIGVHHNEDAQRVLREFLNKIRDRYNNEVYICIALLSPEHFTFGGDLLFSDEETLEPSGFVDTYLVQPPGSMPSIPSLREQISNALFHVRQEFNRRAQGLKALPALGSPGWVQSLADPRSRELWMTWVPRYAIYRNENPTIIGQTGTGKTNLAFALHMLGDHEGDFVSITPRDFSSSELVQAELFGAVDGAYTGAVDKWGLVQRAEKGTLFIDELQSIDKDLQGKLITFIENKTYRRVGSSKTVEADVRFVFASNKTLYDMMETDILRDDFAYRLERMQLDLESLSARKLDIASALAYSLAKVQRQRPLDGFISGTNSAAYRLLCSHSWPGNLRQLENNVARLCELCDLKGASLINEEAVVEVFKSKLTGDAITPEEVISFAAQLLGKTALTEGLTSLDESVERFVETARIVALEASGGSVSEAAAMLSDEEELMQLVIARINAERERVASERR